MLAQVYAHAFAVARRATLVRALRIAPAGAGGVPAPRLALNFSVAGRRNFLWPLEDISPSRGFTVGANLAYRY